MSSTYVDPEQGDRVRTLGELLRRYRERAGLTQEELAGRAGISVRSVRDIERNRVIRPRASSLRRLATALDLPDGALPPGVRTVSRPWIGVLGPLVVRRGDEPVEITSAMQAALLALLALYGGRTVSTDEIVDVLWGDDPPRSCLRLVHTYVGQIRTVLEPDRPARTPTRLLRRVRAGYRLDLDADQLDLAGFDELVSRAGRARAETDLPAAMALLDTALGCWRGPVLVGAGPRLGHHPAAVAVAGRRVAAARAYSDIALDLGRPADIVGPLRGILHDEPLHEALAAQLVRALARCGEQAAALDLYAEVRDRLAEELAIEPGPELREAHVEVLRGHRAAQADAPGRPAQLPAPVRHLVGRAAELSELTRLTGDGTVVITGSAGVGKTALAVTWAHRVADRFPDGHLYVNLRGYDPGGAPLDPATVLRRFLDAFGVAHERIPADVDARAAMYRSVLAGRRMLIVLDNARDGDQVRALLPGSRGCLVVVTSRNRLAGLVATDAARPIPLDLMSVVDSRELLTNRLDRDRVAAESSAVDEVIRMCARLPLALVLVAARAATTPGLTLTALAGELAQAHGSLDAFAGPDAATDVRTVFSWSYHALGSGAAALFRLLGIHPGPDITASAAASLAGSPLRDVRRLLAELVRAQLVAEPVPGRYTYHDLLRAYAAEQARDAEPAAVHRMLDHYLCTAHAAAIRLDPRRCPLTLPDPRGGVTPEVISEYEQAMAWFTAEHAVILGVISRAAAVGLDVHAWQLAWCLSTFLERRGHWRDWLSVQHAALAATDRLGDRWGQAVSHNGLGLAYAQLDQLDEAHDHYLRALDLFDEMSNPTEQARTHMNLCWIYERHERTRDALDHAEQALTLYQKAEYQAGQADALNNIGWYHAQMGNHEQALSYCWQALDIQRRLGNRHGEADAWDSIGYAHHQLGQHAEAIDAYREALDRYRADGDRYGEADVLTHLGEAHHAAADPDAATGCWQQALRILDDLDHPDASHVRARLGS